MSAKKVLYLYIKSENGYGQSAVALKKALRELESAGAIEVDMVAANQEQLMTFNYQPIYDIGIIHFSPISYFQHYYQNGVLKSIISRCKEKYQYMMYETDRIPQQLQSFYETQGTVDGFIIPSQLCYANMPESLKEKSAVVPLNALDLDVFPTTKEKQNIFRVLTVAQMSVRKALDVSIVAFATAFAGHNDVEYVIKAGERIDITDPDGMVKGNIAKSMVANPPPVYIIEDQLSQNEINSLYEQAECYLHLSRGEGFGLSPFRARQYDIPVVYSEWGAHCEFLHNWNSINSLPVGGRNDLVHSMNPQYGFEVGMEWFEASVKEAVNQLRNAYELWKAKPDGVSEIHVDDDFVNEYSYIMAAQKLIDLVHPEASKSVEEHLSKINYKSELLGGIGIKKAIEV